MRSFVVGGVVLCLLFGLASSFVWTTSAHADEWNDARKEFRRAVRSPGWTARREAYVAFARFDDARTVGEMLAKLGKEESAAVVLRALSLLASFQDREAQEALAHAAGSGRGKRKTYAVLALRDQPEDGGASELLKVLRGRDSALAGQAAVALGAKGVEDALPLLVEDLGHKEWQRRAAAARGLRLLTRNLHDIKHAALVGDDKPEQVAASIRDRRLLLARQHAWAATGSSLKPLFAALARSDGVERRELLASIELVRDQTRGLDVDVGTTTRARAPGEAPTAHVLGIPLHGKRIVLIVDTGSDTEDAHPFKDRERLQELCRVPGARDVPWIALRTRKQFFTAHASRIVQDLPDGSRFDVIGPTLNLHLLFGKLTKVNPGTRRAAVQYIQDLPIENGVDHFAALNQALDVAGKTDSVARLKGPDEVVFFATTPPWRADVTDLEVIGAEIALKARMRMVPIHTIGVGDHPFAMMRPISKESGGAYLDLSR